MDIDESSSEESEDAQNSNDTGGNISDMLDHMDLDLETESDESDIIYEPDPPEDMLPETADLYFAAQTWLDLNFDYVTEKRESPGSVAFPEDLRYAMDLDLQYLDF